MKPYLKMKRLHYVCNLLGGGNGRPFFLLDIVDIKKSEYVMLLEETVKIEQTALKLKPWEVNLCKYTGNVYLNVCLVGLPRHQFISMTGFL